MPEPRLKLLLQQCSQVFFDGNMLNPLIEEVNALSSKCKDKGLLNKIKVYEVLNYFKSGQYDKYLKESKKLIKRLEHYKIDAHLGILYLYSGISNNIFGNYTKAFQFEQEAIKIFKKVKNKPGLVLSEMGLAAILRDQGLIMPSLDKLLLCVNQTNKTNLRYLYLICQFELYVLYSGELGQYKLAEKCMDSIEEVIHAKDVNFKQKLNYYFRCACLSEFQKKYKTAIRQLDKLLKLKGQFKNDYFEMSIHYLYGSIYHNLKDYKASIDHYKKAIKHGTKINAKPSIGKFYYSLAKVRISQKQYKKAKQHLAKAEELARESNSNGVLAFVYKYQQEVAEAKQDINAAYLIFKARHELEKENFRSDVKFQVEAIKSFSELNKNEKVVKELLNELNIKKQELATANIFLDKKDTLIDHIDTYVSNMKNENSKEKLALDELHVKIKEAQLLDVQQEQLQEKLNEESNNFILSLRQKHKGITLTQARIAHFIAKGFTSKEIANVFITGVRNIEQHRYRMRQKFKVKKGKTLSSYLQEFLIETSS